MARVMVSPAMILTGSVHTEAAGAKAVANRVKKAAKPAASVWTLPVSIIAGLTMTLANTTALF
ncbi:MAG: hypothetical protein ACKO4W_00025, partial [Bacteroidota bacterium]